MKNVFDSKDVTTLIERINALTPDTSPQWGTMNVAQMLAHVNVPYEFVYETKHPKPGALKQWLMRLFIKNAVVNNKPYPKNSRTAPEFLVTDQQDFDKERTRLISYLEKTLELGATHFDGKESRSFGPLTAAEWNNMFYKHLDHHLTQFGV